MGIANPDSSDDEYRRQHAFHRHSDSRLIVFLAGRHRERNLGLRQEFNPGDILIRPNLYLHDGAGTSNTRYRTIYCSREQKHAFFQRHGWQPRRWSLARDDLGRLIDGKISGSEVLNDVPIKISNPAPADTQMEEVADELSDLASSRVSISKIAAFHGFKPWELSREFKLEFGVTPERYRLLSKLDHAMQLIFGTFETMASIAVDAGFSDQSHLHRTLLAETGLKPGEFAELARNGDLQIHSR